MDLIDVADDHKDEYNAVVNHPLQSYEWGEFRKKTGVKVVRKALVKNGKITDGFTLTLHKIPSLPFFVGYLPKGNQPSDDVLTALAHIGKEEKCVYIQLEPNVVNNLPEDISSKLVHSFHPLFTKYTFMLDITPSEENLLQAMHSKTRYNIRVAQKHGVVIQEEQSEDAFKEYLRLTHETTTRQKFYTHTPTYHKKMWETLRTTRKKTSTTNNLSAHLFTARFQDEILTTWILFVFHDTLYYPYGASSRNHREVMASNLIMWEAIKFGKNLGLKSFDMWGALGPNPDPKDPWIGFHKFKQGYGAQLVEFAGSYDLVINPSLYQVVKLADKLRWVYLRLKK